MKTQKNKLLLSAISLFLCFAMLIGTTYAWFTDSVTSEGNIIQTGNLQVGMQWSNTLLSADSNEWNDVNGAIFTYNNWEPGYTDVKYVKITNNGSLNLKWKLTIEAEAQVSALADIIDVYYVNPVTVSISSLDGLTSAGKLTKVLEERVNSTGALTPEQSTILAIAFHMPEDAGNEYQNLSLCDGGFSINLVATQETGESDSFGDNYDVGADWGENTVNFAASTAINSTNIVYGALANDVVIGAEGINATVPANVKLADGTTNLALTVKAVETDANITVGEGLAARSLDVHIEGVSPDNTVPMTVNLGSIFKPGLDKTEVKIYHTENGTPTLMTRVESVNDFARHNQFTYNAATGEVTIYVATFSVFSVVQAQVSTWNGQDVTTGFEKGTGTEADPFVIKTAAQLVYFRNQVDAGVSFDDQYVKLDADIDLRNYLFDPIGFGYTYGKDSTTAFMGTFDGGNHTIYNLYQNGWDLDPNPGVYDTYTYSTAGGGLFASIENATIKNLVVSGADIKFECVDIGIVCGYAQGNCHFENIVVTNSKIANYNRATGGLLGEVCYGSYGTDVNAGFSHTFKNIVIDSSVTVSSLWGSFDTLCGGVIGGKWGDATVKMENVVSACTLDVFSDCTAAYQWFAYRRCGMLIGHTEQNSPKKALNAAAGFLVCENVDVYYGDWVNYHYYQFTNQTDANGASLWNNNYPWVRAEAGLNNGAFSNPRYGVPVVNGVKVTENNGVEELKTDYTPIVFNQLYGGGQGVYGCSEHDGVTTHNNLSNVKTVYIVNNQGLSGLKLRSWFKHDKSGETWTTNIDGIDMTAFTVAASNGIENAYEVILPAYADGFEILYNGEVIGTFEFANLTQGAAYNLDGSVHSHVYSNGVCSCGYACQHTGGSATCTSSGACTVCGVGYIPATGHSLYWASDNETYCYKKCHNCSHAEGTTSHTWTNGQCSQCKKVQNMLSNLSDDELAYLVERSISVNFKGGSKEASAYKLYVMQGADAKIGMEISNIGTVTFNVSSLDVGYYSIVVVDTASGKWVAQMPFAIVNAGVQKIWYASDLINASTNFSWDTGSGIKTESTANKSWDNTFVKFTCTTPSHGENQLRITVDAQGDASWNVSDAYLVIKFKKNTWMGGVELIPSVNKGWTSATAKQLGTSADGSVQIARWGSLYSFSNMDGLILDFFTDGTIAKDQWIAIEYIAFVTQPGYIS